MRVRGIVFWLFAAWATSPVVAETTFPYRTTVGVADAEVRSGPGEEHYTTAKMAQGTTVEVYRHVKDRWCAIRPPEGSFSWVSARYVEKADDPNLGTVTESNVPSRIGSPFGRQRYAVQIRLDAGESVEILGEQNNGGQSWYQIAPPAGEFRWIDRRLLAGAHGEPRETGDRPRADGASVDESADALWPDSSREKTAPLAPPDFQQPSDSATEINRVRESPAPEPNALSDARSDAPSETDRRDRWHQGGAPDWREPSIGSLVPERVSASKQGRLRHPKNSTPLGFLASRTSPEGEGAGPGVANRSHEDGRWKIGGLPGFESSRDDFSEERDAIEFSLSHMVSGEPGTWRFNTLRKRATALLAAAPTPGDRADIRQILAQIARFDELQHRRAAISGRRRLAMATQQHRGSSQPLYVKPFRPRIPEQSSPAPATGALSTITDQDRVQSSTVAALRNPNGWASAPRSAEPSDRPEDSVQAGSGTDRNRKLSQSRKTTTSLDSLDLRGSPENGERRSGVAFNRFLEEGWKGNERRPKIDPRGRAASRGASEAQGDVVQIPEDNTPLPDRSTQYDAAGVLKRVGSRRRDAPRFAVVDSTGDISSFITPSPGVNLQPYVGRYVGVFGTRGFMPEYRRSHVTAARVTPIDARSRTR